jgi:hypothetical protein
MLRSRELHPNAENATPEELCVAMEAAPNKRSFIRLSAMRALLLGYSRPQVCELNDRTDRMVRLWISCSIGSASMRSSPNPNPDGRAK